MDVLVPGNAIADDRLTVESGRREVLGFRVFLHTPGWIAA